MNAREKLNVLRRDFDARRLNAVVNDADVRPHVLGPEGPLDLTPIVMNLHNVSLMTDHGGLVFLQLQPMVYEVHAHFLPVAHGDEALATTREAQRWMFSRTDAVEFQMKFPEENKRVLGLVRAMRARLEFESRGWKNFVIRYPDWVQNDPSNKHVGAWFREMLEAKLLTKGINIGPWVSEDAAQDAAIGATITTIQAGQLDKALLFYDRWAQFAQAPLLTLVSRWPLAVYLGQGILVVFDESLRSFEVETGWWALEQQ